jgi:Inner membrane protein YgaP-like, transmembrane domain
MERNISVWERVIRAIIGILLLGLYGAIPAPWKYVTLIGLIPLGTALTGHCPAYRMCGIHRTGPGPRPQPS